MSKKSYIDSFIFLNVMKDQLEKLKDKILAFCNLIFSKTNELFFYIFKNLFFNFSNFLIIIIFLIFLVFYQAIIDVLNFELFGKQYNFGDSLNNLVALGFEATWNLMLQIIRSFSPNGLLGLAFELITETIAFILFLIGYIIYFIVVSIKFSWFLITQFGLYNILVILSWSYLIGMYSFVYKNILVFLETRKTKNKLVNLEDKSEDDEVNAN